MFPSLRQRRYVQWEPFYRRSLPTEINVPGLTATPLCLTGTIPSEEPRRRRSMFPSLRQRRLIQWEHYNIKTVRINGCLKNLQTSGSGHKNQPAAFRRPIWIRDHQAPGALSLPLFQFSYLPSYSSMHLQPVRMAASGSFEPFFPFHPVVYTSQSHLMRHKRPRTKSGAAEDANDRTQLFCRGI